MGKPGSALAKVRLDQLPPGVNAKQYALAVAVVNGASTWSEAMREAGYSPATINARTLETRLASGVQTSLEAVRKRQMGNRDKAREIIEIALDKSLDGIKTESDVARLLPAAKLAADVASTLESDGSGPQMSMSPQQQRLLIRRAIIRYARMHGCDRAMPSWLDATV